LERVEIDGDDTENGKKGRVRANRRKVALGFKRLKGGGELNGVLERGKKGGPLKA